MPLGVEGRIALDEHVHVPGIFRVLALLRPDPASDPTRLAPGEQVVERGEAGDRVEAHDSART
jgi:hypothetical protein